MAIVTEDDVISAYQKRQQMQRDQVRNAVVAAPQMFGATRRGDYGRVAYLDQKYGTKHRAPVDPMSTLEAKTKLLDKFAEIDKDMRTNEAKSATDVLKQDFEMKKKAMELALDTLKVAPESSASVLASFNNGLSAATTKGMENLVKFSDQAGGGGAGSWSSLVNTLQSDALDLGSDQQVAEAIKGTFFWQALATAASDPENPDAVRATLMVMDKRLQDAGLGGITGAAATAGPAASQFIEKISNALGTSAEIGATVRDAQAMFQQEMRDDFVNTAAKGVAGVDPKKVIEAYNGYYEAFKAGDPDAALQTLDKNSEGESKPKDPNEILGKLDAMLDDLGKYDDDPNPPQNAREVKEDIMASDWFRGFKEANNLTDNKMAWKAARQFIKGKVAANRTADQARLREVGGVGGLKPPKPPDRSGELTEDEKTGELRYADGTVASDEDADAYLAKQMGFGDPASAPPYKPPEAPTDAEAGAIKFGDEKPMAVPLPAAKTKGAGPDQGATDPVSYTAPTGPIGRKAGMQIAADILAKRKKPKYTDWGLA